MTLVREINKHTRKRAKRGADFRWKTSGKRHQAKASEPAVIKSRADKVKREDKEEETQERHKAILVGHKSSGFQKMYGMVV